MGLLGRDGGVGYGKKAGIGRLEEDLNEGFVGLERVGISTEMTEQMASLSLQPGFKVPTDQFESVLTGVGISIIGGEVEAPGGGFRGAIGKALEDAFAPQSYGIGGDELGIGQALSGEGEGGGGFGERGGAFEEDQVFAAGLVGGLGEGSKNLFAQPFEAIAGADQNMHT
jgi:hypothetical protein